MAPGSVHWVQTIDAEGGLGLHCVSVRVGCLRKSLSIIFSLLHWAVSFRPRESTATFWGLFGEVQECLPDMSTQQYGLRQDGLLTP